MEQCPISSSRKCSLRRPRTATMLAHFAISINSNPICFSLIVRLDAKAASEHIDLNSHVGAFVPIARHYYHYRYYDLVRSNVPSAFNFRRAIAALARLRRAARDRGGCKERRAERRKKKRRAAPSRNRIFRITGGNFLRVDRLIRQ